MNRSRSRSRSRSRRLKQCDYSALLVQVNWSIKDCRNSFACQASHLRHLRNHKSAPWMGEKCQQHGRWLCLQMLQSQTIIMMMPLTSSVMNSCKKNIHTIYLCFGHVCERPALLSDCRIPFQHLRPVQLPFRLLRLTITHTHTHTLTWTCTYFTIN